MKNEKIFDCSQKKKTETLDSEFIQYLEDCYQCINDTLIYLKYASNYGFKNSPITQIQFEKIKIIKSELEYISYYHQYLELIEEYGEK